MVDLNSIDILGFEISTSARDDGTVEAVYVRVGTGRVATTKELNDDILLGDYDEKGNLIGLEILAPVKLSELEKQIERPRRDAFRRFVKKSAPQGMVTCP